MRRVFNGKLDARDRGDRPDRRDDPAGRSAPPTRARATGATEALSTDLGAKSKFVEVKIAQSTGVDLTKADVIVSGGRGVGAPEKFPEVIQPLADALGGAMGASRPVVDAGWLDHPYQVGSSGQIVAPKLYIAAGISGAIQHLVGMKASNFIIAINKDPDAPDLRGREHRRRGGSLRDRAGADRGGEGGQGLVRSVRPTSRDRRGTWDANGVLGQSHKSRSVRHMGREWLALVTDGSTPRTDSPSADRSAGSGVGSA